MLVKGGSRGGEGGDDEEYIIEGPDVDNMLVDEVSLSLSLELSLSLSLSPSRALELSSSLSSSVSLFLSLELPSLKLTRYSLGKGV